jgi:ABC-type polysaccharide/polyol phosphate transport system ATPase subunit
VTFSAPDIAPQGAPAAPVEYALDIVGLSKEFVRRTRQGGRSGYTTLKSALLAPFRRRSAAPRVVTHAIRDLTVRIPQGSSVGIIGRNGSGKSTFLKLVTGIYKPTRGTVAVNGRVAALIELGAGFHPDFTGRENLFLGGVMLGLSRAEIEARFATIVRFAELDGVIDDPVRTYSSGMFMRLGFSLAVHTDPDVLIIDEVLAVGDAAFVAKCKDKIAELRRAGKTLILVSHDLDAVERWCDEVVWLHSGEVKDRGEPRRVIDRYRAFLERGEEAELEATQRQAPGVEVVAAPAEGSTAESGRWGSREIEITGIKILNQRGESHLLFHTADPVRIEMTYAVRGSAEDTVFGIAIHRIDGLAVFGTNTAIERVELPELGQGGLVAFEIERLGLLDGTYRLDVAVHRSDGYPFDYHQGALRFSVRSPVNHVGVFEPAHRWQIEPHQIELAARRGV